MKRLLLFLVPVVLVFVVLPGCLKKDFDAPPDRSRFDPQIPVTHTVSQLLKMNGAYNGSTGGDTTRIADSVVISGVVIADDRSGNFFKRIVIDDGTAGVAVLIDAYSLYNDYPVGRKVYIRCGGLYLGYENGLPVLGAAATQQMSLRGIEGAAVNSHIVKGGIGHPVVSDTLDLITASAARPEFYNRLITLRNVQFSDTGLTFTAPNASTSRTIVDCDANTLILRSSNYAGFAAYKMPSGKGYITGVYTVYVGSQASPQLAIRDTSDVRFTSARCGGSAADVISIDSLRRMYEGRNKTLGKVSIRGVVISDRAHSNIASRNLILQDGERGIAIRFSGSHSFDLGDELIVGLANTVLTEFSQMLQIGGDEGLPTVRATRVGTGRAITPKVLTIAQLTGADFELYESTLVKIMGVSIGSGTFDGNKAMSDATNSTALKLFTTSYASFAAAQVPAGRVNVTGVVGQYNATRQFSIRNTNDIE